MTELTLDTKLAIPPQVMARLVDGETVLLDLESGTYFGVDGVGQRIWEFVSEGRTIGETVERIIAEYDIDEGTARKDALEFAQELVERGLLETASAD